MEDFNTGLSAEQLMKALNAIQTINNEEPDENHNIDINVVAADVSYDNTDSNLEAENAQDAIDEVVEKIEQTNTSVTTNTTNITNLQTQVTSNTSNISTINTTTTSLQNQINNIVTPVTVDAEVQNARVGSDSTSYTSLKDRLDSENTSLKEDLSELNESLYELQIFIHNPTVEYLGNYVVGPTGYLSPNANFDSYIVDLQGVTSVHIDNVTVLGGYESMPTTSSVTCDGIRHGADSHDFDVLELFPNHTVRYLVISVSVDTVAPNVTRGDGKQSVIRNISENTLAVSEISEIVHLYTNVDLNEEAELVEGAFLQFNKQFIEVSTLNYYKLPIDNTKSYSITSQTYSNAVCYGFVDSDDNVISVFPESKPAESTAYTRHDIEIPSNAAYIIVNDLHRGGLLIAPKVETYTIERSIKQSALPEIISGDKLKNDMANFLLVTAGDSITEGLGIEGGSSMPINDRPTHGKIAADYYGMSYSNISMSGRTMADVRVNGVTRNGFAVERYLLVPQDCDYLTIMFGWNDGAYGANSLRDDYCMDTYGDYYLNLTPEQKADADAHADWEEEFLGDLDSSNKKTWSGAWNFVLEYFTTTYIIPHLGVIIPYLSASNEFYESMRTRLIDICERYGVSYFDIANPHDCPSIGYGSSGESALANAAILKTTYTADGTHPNKAGYKRIARAYIDFLKRI